MKILREFLLLFRFYFVMHCFIVVLKLSLFDRSTWIPFHVCVLHFWFASFSFFHEIIPLKMNCFQPLRLPLFSIHFVKFSEWKSSTRIISSLSYKEIFFPATIPLTLLHQRNPQKNTQNKLSEQSEIKKNDVDINTKWKQGYRLSFKQTVQALFFFHLPEQVTSAGCLLSNIYLT